VCKGSGVAARVRWDAVPLLPEALDLVRQGHKTGASARNWAGYSHMVDLGAYGEAQQVLLTDPQTSGGLLVACAPGAVDDVLALFRAERFDSAAVIGEFVSGSPRVDIV
jgi:selenide,water dikinase